ncbi:MAG TPA: aldo/keto reductase [Bacillota bacterium]|nr:aldo/keto reductase [Bacillota bacterium]
MTHCIEMRLLGGTNIPVSRLCFGTLTIGPLQANLPIQEGASLIRAAIERGVNFLDTAELYGTYPYIREAISGMNRSDIVIASRSYDYTYESMKKSVEFALRSMNIDYLDLFLLHEQESALTLKGHREALRYLEDARDRGIIRAIGVSTHYIQCVEAALGMPEIDVIHPLLNYSGIGIADGTVSHMLQAIEMAHSQGKGIYSMKAIGGGALLHNVEGALKFAIEQPCVDSIAVGIKTLDELEMDLAIFEGREPDKALRERTCLDKALLIEPWCIGCGECVKKCSHGALSVVSGRAVVDKAKCVLCGYCQAVCPEVCMKVV